MKKYKDQDDDIESIIAISVGKPASSQHFELFIPPKIRSVNQFDDNQGLNVSDQADPEGFRWSRRTHGPPE